MRSASLISRMKNVKNTRQQSQAPRAEYLQGSDRDTRKVHRETLEPSPMESRGLYMSHLAPSEPVYLDIERNIAVEHGRTPPYVAPKSPLAVVHAKEHTLPVVYHDPVDHGSVMTGQSQQELLRKKARQDDKKSKKYGKKKKRTILNMPSQLSGNTIVTLKVRLHL
jgi:hypothetical protein